MSKGEFARATDAFDRCIAEGGHAPLGACFARHGEEPHIVALQYKGYVLAVRGLTDSGLAHVQSALSLARTMNFPLIVAFTSAILATVLLLRRDGQACVSLTREQIEYCSEHRFVFWSAAFEIHHGAARACLNGDPAGVAELERGILDWRKTGAELHVPTWSSFLADAALVVGDLDTAERALSDGIETSERHGDVFALAELQRLVGRLRLKQERRSLARRALEEAVGTARRQDAGLYLLRAGRDLAQLIADDGDATGARDILKPIVGSITEHRAGLDFQEASALLAGLERQA